MNVASILMTVMTFARAICNRVFFMDEGGIYEDGTPEQIFDHPERENTRRFVQKLKVLELNITEKEHDFPGAVGLILEYCNKHRISQKLENRTLLAFEELVEQLLLRTLRAEKIRAVMEYSEKEDQMAMVVRFSGPIPEGYPVSGDLSTIILKSAITTAEFSRDEGNELPNQVILHVRNPETENNTAG